MTAGRGTRAVRAAVFAVVCVLLAALGHAVMSGTPVPRWAMAAGCAATAAAAWAPTRRERGLGAVTAATVAVQTLLHSGFSLAQAMEGAAAPGGRSSAVDSWLGHVTSGLLGTLHPVGGTAASAGHGHAGHAPDSAALAHGAVGMDPLGMDPLGMAAAHVLAALICGLWLAHGERAAFRVLRAAASRLAAPLRLPLSVPLPTPRPPRSRRFRDHAVRAPRRLLLVYATPLRGPPS
ncbi:hypothetical protein QCN29_04585 [Streptomyces sp. HNM0663]|uniref:Integral-membrane protein n=1 Tax=Streptomyces chengmaiensis TaxID=3040919 RepID=A0ABT6HIF3_9ACTN|nr:hypothetical protein [Streptomyces chengmaiensis]MDH2388075.1 hypothetical protein [Streptomyces chengmaiensis]